MSRPNYGGSTNQQSDQQFFERARRKSPVFPSLAEAEERRRQRREALMARTMIAGALAGSAYSFWSNTGFAVAGLCFVGLVATCFYAGNRQYVRQGGAGRDHRPF
jgi:hypothetical protein